MARFLVALVQLTGAGLVIASIWNILDPWFALLLLGILLTVGGLGAERARTERSGG